MADPRDDEQQEELGLEVDGTVYRYVPGASETGHSFLLEGSRKPHRPMRVRIYRGFYRGGDRPMGEAELEIKAEELGDLIQGLAELHDVVAGERELVAELRNGGTA
jgi:hypothetical protein